MAYHGGPASLPRAHRPRAPIMSVPAPITAPLAPLRSSHQLPAALPPPPPTQHQHHPPVSSARSISSSTSNSATVSLVAPRPDSERQSNEYVDTPFRLPSVVGLPSSSPPPPPRVQRSARLPIPPPPPPSTALSPPVTKQPQLATTATTTTINTTSTTSSSGVSKEATGTVLCDTRQSIICGECGRCRCQSCQQPRPLPECWTSTYRCSADTVIDYASCLCCVKGLFYHCTETDGGDTCVDEPCNCGPDRRTARWGCLAALSCVLPCLLLYWPLQCSKRVAETCYARHSRLGCRCRPKAGSAPASAASVLAVAAGHAAPEKRLLDAASPDF